MVPNLYTFNPFFGVVAGIRLKTDAIDPRTQKRRPEHVPVGEAFVAVDKTWRRPPLKNGLLMEAGLRTVAPLSGRQSFQTLFGRQSESGKLVVIDLQTPERIKPHVTPELVNARFFLQCYGNIEVVQNYLAQGSALVEFIKEGAEIDIWSADGMIYRLILRADEIVQVQLSFKEMAAMRVQQFEGQIQELDLDDPTDVRRYHGIIAGATRLLRYVRNSEAVNVLVDFLTDQVGPKLTEKIREEIRGILLERGHILAGTFAPMMYGANVVPIRPVPIQAESVQKRTMVEARRNANRAERDALSQSMKGSSGGGKQKKGK